MSFVFKIGGDGRLEITGTPTDPGDGEVFERVGQYRLEGDRLVSPVMNDGNPVRVVLQGGGLVLTIDETLEFRLRRER